MDIIILIVCLLLFAVLASSIVAKIKLPLEIFLLLASIGISLIPELPHVELKPQTAFFIFLPPILFHAAFFTSWRDFVANKRPITLLAVGLVLFTMLAVGTTLKLLIPTLSWSWCLLLGAIVSPTDASSAVTLVKKMGVPRRLITIIEGESLINDATALIAYRYTLAAVMTGTFSLWWASIDFVIAASGGIILGYGFGYISIRIFVWLQDAKARSIFSITIPYIVFMLADFLNISAIIAVVTAGIYLSRKMPLVVSAESRQQAETVWEVFIFAMNALIFALIGLEFRSILNELKQFSVHELIYYAMVINLVVILVRFIWVYPAAYIPRFLSPTLRKRDPYPSWTQLATLSYIGMRGILSLILVLSLPYFLPSGESFPFRSLLIFFTYTVILITVVLPTLTLATLGRFFKFEEDRQHCKEEALARVESAKAVLEELDQHAKDNKEISDYIRLLRQKYKRKIEILETNLKDTPYSSINVTDQQIRKLNRNLINVERKIIIELRSNGIIHDEVFHHLEKELDLEDLRLKTQRI